MEISDLIIQEESGCGFLISIPSSTEYLEPVRKHFTRLLSGYYDSSSVNKIVLAIDEALSNAMIHGNKKRQDVRVDVRYAITEEGIMVCIKDNGEGFDLSSWKEWYQKSRAGELNGIKALQYHQQKEKGGGMGLSMIHKIMDHIDFNERGNEITMVKRFTA